LIGCTESDSMWEIFDEKRMQKRIRFPVTDSWG